MRKELFNKTALENNSQDPLSQSNSRQLKIINTNNRRKKISKPSKPGVKRRGLRKDLSLILDEEEGNTQNKNTRCKNKGSPEINSPSINEEDEDELDSSNSGERGEDYQFTDDNHMLDQQ
ncbi:UNKNOWN [Stylonychia lemnae]|uniref:Uncharacterized protein n=1 Tax=Stylonychia lemnae TaxID=5949 RepID=A0A078AK68_STYLE|nr:UNKNOWN [Stylonychia lemnae]|eukprot:CDW81852.1 UNKNOWN [Stylonychia lemnae]